MSLPRLFTFALLAASLLLTGLAGPAAAAGGKANAGGGGGGGGDGDVPGEILVKLRNGDALKVLLRKYPLTLVDRFGSRPIFRLKVIGNVASTDLLAALALEPEVMLAEGNAIHSSPEARRNAPWAIGTPGDYAAQWAPQAMHLAAAQSVASGAGVRVAVLDTGVDRNHPLLAGRLLPGFDFVDFDTDPSEVGSVANLGFGHGTHVAGLIAMVAPNAQIMPLRVLDADGVGNAWVLAEAMLYAIDPDGNPATDDGAHVINLSLGSLTRTRLLASIASIIGCEAQVADDPISDRSDAGYGDDESRCKRANGAVVVAAAGNDSSANVKEYPAAEGAHGLLSVGASNAAGRLAGFSNNGSWVMLAAPGEGITSAVPGGFGTWSGTSMAAPLAAGTAALIRSMDLRKTPKDVVRQLLRNTTTLCGTALRQVDAAAAVNNTAPVFTACR